MYTLVDLCLLCLTNNNNLKSIYSKDLNSVLVEEKLRFFLLEVVNIKPELSIHICSKCLRKIDQVNKFKQLCLQNIVQFNNYVNTLQNTETPNGKLQITLIDLKHLSEKLTNSELENVTETEYALQSTLRQKREVVKVLRKQNHDNIDNNNEVQGNNVPPKENEELECDIIGDIKANSELIYNSKYRQQNEHTQEIQINEDALRQYYNLKDVFPDNKKPKEKTVVEDQVGQMIVDDEFVYEFIEDIVKDEPEQLIDDIDLKLLLNTDSEYKLKSKTTSNTDHIKRKISSLWTSEQDKSNKHGQFRTGNDTVQLKYSGIIEPEKTNIVEPCRGQRHDKKQCCKYCMELVMKLPRHLKNNHANELEVAKFMKLKPNDKGRLRIIEKIRNHGNYLHNYKSGKKPKQIIVKRRPAKHSQSSSEFLPCQFCFATLKKNKINNHEASCNDKNALL